jgi:transketolase
MLMLNPDPTVAAEWRARRRELAAEPPASRAEALAGLATALRRTVIRMIGRAGMGHVGGDLSVVDILVTLYGVVLTVDPERPWWPERDRFILSKGHCSAALYATLASCGFFPYTALDTYLAPLSPLNGHPNRTEVPGVEANTGPLGHGLPVAVGCALAARLRSLSRYPPTSPRATPSRTVVILGDGELQEGSNWEAAMTAAHHRLAGLTAVVDRNRLQQGAGTEETNRLDPLPAKWRAFGWEVREVDGHDHAALLTAFEPAANGRPVAVIAHTVKGKGVSFMEDRVEWHHRVPDAGQIRAALAELIR